MSYADFEEKIPEEKYGTGKIEIWDKGEHKILEMNEKTLKFKENYVLYKFPKAGKNSYLLFKIKNDSFLYLNSKY